MRKIILYFVLISANTFAQSTLITPGTNQPNIIANGTNNGGITPPRMTNAQIAAIASPTIGSMVFDTDVNCLRIFDGSKWSCQTEADGPVVTGYNQYGTSDDQGNDIVVRGNYVYVVGEFSGTMTFLTFPNTTFISDGGKDAFVAKFNKSGSCIWAKHIKNTNEANAVAVAVDANENVYVGGNFIGNVLFGTSGLTGIGQRDIFLSKYDTNGNLTWYQLAGGTAADSLTDIAVNSLGELFITGNFRGTVDYSGIGSANATSAGETDVFLAKYNTNTGGFISFIRGGDTNYDTGLKLFVNSTNIVYLTGSYRNNISFPPKSTSSPYQEGFIGTFNNNLSPNLLVNTTQDLRTALIAPPGQEASKKSYPFGLFVQNDGTCLISNSIMTIPQPFVSASFYFNLPTITKYDGSLASQFTKLCHLTSFPEGSPEYKNYFNCDIKADAQGSIYGISSHFNSTVAGYDSTGYLESNQYFANNKVIGNSYFGGIDFQIVKYTPNGIPIWVKTFGSSSNDFATAMDITPQGEVFITGYISGNATFGNLQITGNGGKDMFILKITE